MGLLKNVFDWTERASARLMAGVVVPNLIEHRQMAMMGFDTYSQTGKVRHMDEETKALAIAYFDRELAKYGVPSYEEYMEQERRKQRTPEPRNG